MRFEELKAQKELRQLQEDKKNDKKPPPYKHIKVRGCGRGQVQKRSLELLVQVLYRYTETFLMFGCLAVLEGFFDPLSILSKLGYSNRSALICCNRSGRVCAVHVSLWSEGSVSLLENQGERAGNGQ